MANTKLVNCFLRDWLFCKLLKCLEEINSNDELCSDCRRLNEPIQILWEGETCHSEADQAVMWLTMTQLAVLSTYWHPPITGEHKTLKINLLDEKGVKQFIGNDTNISKVSHDFVRIRKKTQISLKHFCTLMRWFLRRIDIEVFHKSAMKTLISYLPGTSCYVS